MRGPAGGTFRRWTIFKKGHDTIRVPLTTMFLWRATGRLSRAILRNSMLNGGEWIDSEGELSRLERERGSFNQAS